MKKVFSQVLLSENAFILWPLSEPLLQINLTITCNFVPSRQISGSYDKIYFLRKLRSEPVFHNCLCSHRQ